MWRPHHVQLNKYFRCWLIGEWPNGEGDAKGLPMLFVFTQGSEVASVFDKIAAHNEILERHS